ncbi:SDR family oxidoreductase [Kibdelosporangium phytohabitans]|uniref:Short-chain dehydrogenase n=1 Tax=Kibdelosporangium phytohabitans TaxID=860235 RepID=A0A0N9HYR5_9PSEU|nr:SDR family oxidoreductase [Kibdelosporangium phytohabitans]ALG07296.1 short-chain dehydrogenase [Kibdelosporangium phytohabitans]MBE1471840.1 short-subunit dehydrogenase/thioester reductase-like protein [Kibdelosporangium phytohabitans]
MTGYFVTGGTGFLGRRLVSRLLTLPDCTAVHVLVRPGSIGRFESLARTWDAGRVVPVAGDLTGDMPDAVPGIDHVVHLGAIYDFTASDEANQVTNVTGTANVIDFAARTGAKWLHHVSSVAVAGDHCGRFTERDFDLGQNLPSPYHATKFAAEKLVRAQTAVPWRVYRPSAVVGDSRTGEMDKVDGPYYFLPAITRAARLPARLPLVAPHLGSTNIVPVDYVVDAMVHLMHQDAAPGATYHLGSPRNQTLTQVYNAFAGPAGAPKVVASPKVPGLARTGRAAAAVAGQVLDRLPGGREARDAVLTELGIPPEVVPHMSLNAKFSTSETVTALAGSGVELPSLASYAPRLLRYWADHLDPYRARRRVDRSDPLAGRRILITGASSGIGRATAVAVAARGAQVFLVARRADELEAVREEITAAGGSAWTYPCDLTDSAAVSALVKQVLVEHESVDMLVNNAGRSIRRSVHLSVDRVHDFERTMALNYFAPLRLTLALLPHMRERRFGHVVTVTTMGLQSDTPRFAAYLASKAAIEEFGRVAGRESLADGITFSSVRMPLVRTPMIAKAAYRTMPAMSPDRAARMVISALVNRQEVVSRPEGVAMELARLVAPRTSRRVANLLYRMMPETAPEARSRPQPPLASVAATLTRLVWRKL